MSLQMEHVLPDGFVYEKAQNIIHGTYRGIRLLIVPVESEAQYQIQFYADVEKNSEKNGFLDWLGSLHQTLQFVHHAGYNGSNLVSVYVQSDGANDKEHLTEAIDTLVLKCEEYVIHNCCAHCKGDLPLHTAAVDNTPLLLCDGCLGKVTSGMNQARVRKENPLFGIIGAVLGVLIGSVLWVVIGQIGFIAGIAGFAIVFCGMKGYDLLGGRLSRGGIVVCVLLSCLAIAGAEFISLGIAIYRNLGEMYVISLGDSFQLIPELMQDSEMVAGVAKDLVVGYALAIWASYSNIKLAWRQVGEGPAQHTVVRF